MAAVVLAGPCEDGSEQGAPQACTALSRSDHHPAQLDVVAGVQAREHGESHEVFAALGHDVLLVGIGQSVSVPGDSDLAEPDRRVGVGFPTTQTPTRPASPTPTST